MKLDTNFWRELSDLQNVRRRSYFQWKNGIENLQMNYGAMTEEEFITHCSQKWIHKSPIKDKKFFLNNMKRWESSAEYKRLLCLWKEDNFFSDIIEVYENVKKKANEGDNMAIKNMLLLQDEIKKYRKSIDDFQQEEEQEEQKIEEEDDGLELTI